MARILRIDMSKLTIRWEDVPAKYEVLGGRGLTSKIVAEEVPPTCNPLGEFNKLVFAPGLLTGTNAPSSGRLSVGSKSPLTGTIKEANAGGVSAQKLANCGIKAIVVEGKADRGCYALYVSKDKTELIAADNCKGLGTYELNKQLRSSYGDRIGVICIGPAGEMMGSNAGISTSDQEGHPGRYAGRGGLGAVMGSKGLKAIIIDSGKPSHLKAKNAEAFKTAARKFTEVLRKHPVTGQALPAYGTAVLVNILNEAGGLPTRNFSSGRFEAAASISGEKIAERVKERGGKGKVGHSCHAGCVIKCSNIYPGPDGNVLCAPIEYETVWSLGANCGIGELDFVARLNYICNDLGLDTIEAGVTLGVAMEAGIVPFGDGDGAIRLLEEVGQGTPLGRVIAQGAAVTGKVFGVTRVPVVKGQGMPAYDPRAVKGIGVTYGTSTMGADHTAGYSVATNILKVGGFVDPLVVEGQAELSRNLQIATAFLDSSGLCLFVAFALLDDSEGLPAVAEMINAQYGFALSVEDLLSLGKEVLRDERSFNKAAGFGPAHDRLPEFFLHEKLPPHDVVFDVSNDDLDSVHGA